MKVKNINKSSLKTDKKIKESFAELVQEKGNISNITVTELVERADITRSSFYTHYDSIYDVVQAIQDETLNVLIEDINFIKNKEDIGTCIDKIFDYLESNYKIYSLIFKSDAPLLFSNRLNRYMSKEIFNILKNADNKQRVKVSFFCDGAMSLIIKHFRGEIDISLDELKEILKDLSHSIIKD